MFKMCLQVIFPYIYILCSVYKAMYRVVYRISGIFLSPKLVVFSFLPIISVGSAR